MLKVLYTMDKHANLKACCLNDVTVSGVSWLTTLNVSLTITGRSYMLSTHRGFVVNRHRSLTFCLVVYLRPSEQGGVVKQRVAFYCTHNPAHSLFLMLLKNLTSMIHNPINSVFNRQWFI